MNLLTMVNSKKKNEHITPVQNAGENIISMILPSNASLPSHLQQVTWDSQA